eukprot:gene57647-biopygen47542
MLTLCAELGMSERILRPLRTMYRRLRRRFRYAGNVAGRRFHSTVGILQGCPLSVTLLTAIMAVWAKVIEAETRLCPAGRTLRSSPAAPDISCTKCKTDIAAGQPAFQCPNAAECPSCQATPLVLCLTCAIAHGAQVESYADDGDVTATGPSDGAAEAKIQKASALTAEFTGLTGTTVAIKKSSAWTTRPRASFRITYQPPGAAAPTPLVTPDAGRHVGAHLLYHGKPVKVPPFIKKKLGNALDFCARAAALPQRADPTTIANILAAAPMSAVLYGCEVTALPSVPIHNIRRAIGECLIPSFQRRRCIEVLLTVFVKGHLLDPLQAVPYRIFTQLRRQMSRSPELQPIIQDIWKARRDRPDSTVDGPGRRLLDAAKAAGWKWSGPTSFTPAAAGAQPVDALALEAAEWGHAAREALRSEQLCIGQRRRATFHNDMGGMEQGINFAATRALWAHRSITRYEARFVMQNVTGATLFARRAHGMGLADSSHCVFCSTKEQPVVETPEHVNWVCPSWEPLRQARSFSPT